MTTIVTPTSTRPYFGPKLHGTWVEADGYRVEYIYGCRTERYESKWDQATRRWHPNGTLAYRGVYKVFHVGACETSTPIGVHMSWREDGSIESRREFLNGSLNGLVEMWSDGYVYCAVYRNGIEQKVVACDASIYNHDG